MLRTTVPVRDQRGASSAEYAILLSLVGVALILAFFAFGGAVSELLGSSATSVANRP